MNRNRDYGDASGGMDVTRLSTTAQDRIWREERQEQARAYLICVSDPEVLDALGLGEAPIEAGTPCGSRTARVARLATGAPCSTCHTNPPRSLVQTGRAAEAH